MQCPRCRLHASVHASHGSSLCLWLSQSNLMTKVTVTSHAWWPNNSSFTMAKQCINHRAECSARQTREWQFTIERSQLSKLNIWYKLISVWVCCAICACDEHVAFALRSIACSYSLAQMQSFLTTGWRFISSMFSGRAPQKGWGAEWKSKDDSNISKSICSESTRDCQ